MNMKNWKLIQVGMIMLASLTSTHAAEAVSVERLDELLRGQRAWFFCGHADAALRGARSLAFVHAAGGFEAVDAQTLAAIVGRHASTLQLVVSARSGEAAPYHG